jgi:hypothetical protein
MSGERSPEMSVVMVTLDCYERIRKAMRHLRSQTVKEQLEIIIVAPSSEMLDLGVLEVKDFLQVRVVAVGPIRSTGSAIAAGMRQASAPVVVYAEEHSYPVPDWAEALIKAHREPWGAVGAVLCNANPGTMMSWAQLFTDFGSSAEAMSGGIVHNLPWHHTSYKRALLEGYTMTELEAFMETEGLLQRDLQAKGYQLYLEPAAKSNHLNVSSLSSLIESEFVGGRLFGAARARYERWSTVRRLVYIVSGPLIPLVRLLRTLRIVRHSSRQHNLLPGILPWLALGLAMHGLGEVVGYAIGAGDAVKRRMSFELNRCRHVAKQERTAPFCN